MSEINLNEYALNYALDYHWAVFPVRQDKQPYTPKGHHDAKTDRRAINHWWGKLFPDANIGISCESSNLLVIDIDKDENTGLDGYQSLKRWERETGFTLPETATAITGRGGMHMYYRYDYDGTDDDPKNRAGVIEGVDIRANGYVVAPPSLHASGRRYEWEISPDEILADADEAVLALCKYGNITQAKKPRFELPQSIGEGQRNDTLYRYGCSLQSQGADDDSIRWNLNHVNNTRCDPPLRTQELEKLIDNVLSVPKNEFKIYYDSGEAHDPVLKRNAKSGQVVQSIPNCVEAITYDRDLFQRVRFNELAGSVYVYGNLPWDVDYSNAQKMREWKNVDDSNLINYMQDNYGLMNEKNIMHALTIVANKRHYNPVCQFLETCKSLYDGGEYVRQLLPKYLGVEDTDYTFEVMHLAMMGAVCRAFVAGCKFDYMPIIVGEQGVGKSAFLRALACSDDWFSDNFNTLDGDKASEKLRGMWILEMAELSALKRMKDAESIKSFISSVDDVYRSPYSRRTESHPRRCVFFGTTNDYSFLTDRTGNRRFLPLLASEERQQVMVLDDLEGARNDICKAWGEIMTEFDSYGGKLPILMLSKDGQYQAESMQERYLEEDVRVPKIQEWLDVNTQLSRVCIAQLWVEVFNGNIKDLSPKTTRELHEIMRKEVAGWVSAGKKRCGEYGVSRCYERV